jgi:hypothetical protein
MPEKRTRAGASQGISNYSNDTQPCQFSEVVGATTDHRPPPKIASGGTGAAARGVLFGGFIPRGAVVVDSLSLACYSRFLRRKSLRMRPKFFTPRNAILFLIALTILVGLVRWMQGGMRLPGTGVPSTAGKLVFVSTRNGHPDLWMMDKDGGNAVALMNDEAEDRQPAFSPNGQEITFVSTNRNGANPQAYVMDAGPNRRPIYLSSSKTAKAHPFFLDERKIGYLDTGKLSIYDTIAQETEAVLPHHDLKNILNDFFSGGGVDQVIALDESNFVAITNIEDGQGVLYYHYEHDDLNAIQMAVLGVAEHIRIAKVPTGGFLVSYEGGGPFPKPFPVITPELLQAYGSGQAKPAWPPVRPQSGERSLALFGDDASIKGVLPLPGPIDSVAMSGDGKGILVGIESDEEHKGLYYFSPESAESNKKLSDLPARDISLSPDGTTVA